MALRGVGPRTRLKRVERLIEELKKGRNVPRERLVRELEEYRFLLQTLWLWQFKK